MMLYGAIEAFESVAKSVLRYVLHLSISNKINGRILDQSIYEYFGIYYGEMSCPSQILNCMLKLDGKFSNALFKVSWRILFYTRSN